MNRSHMLPAARARALHIAVAIFVAGAAFALLPMWVPLLLAAWTAELTRGVARRLERAAGGRRAVAAAMTLGLLLAVLVPFSLAVASLVVSGIDLIRRVTASHEVHSALQALVSDGGARGVELTDLLDPRHFVALAREHGAQAWSLLRSFAGVTADFVIQLFVYLLGTHAFLTEGEALWAWLVARTPLDPSIALRLRNAFHETGRGLIVGHGGTSLAQAMIAVVAYQALGVPRALTLAQLTFFASFVPSFGTGLVWAPVAAGLAHGGEYAKALTLVLVGLFVIGTIDNVLRPLFSRWGKLELPVFLQLVSIFGGFIVFGAWGFLAGPLLVRLAKEALDILQEERAKRTA